MSNEQRVVRHGYWGNNRSAIARFGARSSLLVALLIAHCSLLVALLAPVPALVVEEGGSGRALARVALTDAPVIVRYRHSLYDALTAEEFVVEGETLVLRRLSSERLAALEYYARAEPPAAAPEGYAIEGLAERHAVLPLLVGPVGQRTLVHGAQVVPLWALPAEGGRVRLRVGQAPRGLLLWEQFRPGNQPVAPAP